MRIRLARKIMKTGPLAKRGARYTMGKYRKAMQRLGWVVTGSWSLTVASNGKKVIPYELPLDVLEVFN